MPTRPLTIWAVSDGRAGIENQVLGLAEAIARLTPAEIAIKRIRYRTAFDWLPVSLKLMPDAMLTAGSDSLRAGPAGWPDIWIGAGRATLPHAVRMKARSGGHTLVVQLQDPTVDLAAFDVVIAPEHDALQGRNVLSLLGSTHRVTPQRLRDEAEAFAGLLDNKPRPYVAVLIGGNSKTHVLTAERARALAGDIRHAMAASGGTLLVTFSRRTPDDAKAAFTAGLGNVPAVIHDGGANPYFAYLDAADAILVTEDSVNMAVEAASTGRPVYTLSLDRRRAGDKFQRFHQSLRDRGIARPFEGKVEAWSYPALDETERAARHVLQSLEARQPA